MVDVSAHCATAPLNPTSLTATGGSLVNGTVNVMIHCVCSVNESSQVPRWYDVNTEFLAQLSHPRYVAGSPYFIHGATIGNVQSVILVIPTFNDSYDGTYHCGIRVNDTTFTSPSTAVTLTINSELMINAVIMYVHSNIVTLSN